MAETTPETTPERLTEAEWHALEVRRKCATYGHAWTFVLDGGDNPVRVFCERGCGAPAYALTKIESGRDE